MARIVIFFITVERRDDRARDLLGSAKSTR
jgi:hypothetical protein